MKLGFPNINMEEEYKKLKYTNNNELWSSW